ncbi:fungal-specific transcription factor domain-containing protein [Mycena galericulata]|nr:fungal-specific transcription factor domain-containing protein [Mycena galericulata]
MASDDGSHPLPQPKRRRLRGACDICRKQKGDSAEMPGNKCSNCITFHSECTHSLPSKAKTENDLFNTLRTPQEHVAFIVQGSAEYVSGDNSALYQVLVAVAQYARTLEEALATTAGQSQLFDAILSPSATELTGDADSDSDNDGVLVDAHLPESLRQITRDTASNRFYGKSSGLNFLKAFVDLKLEPLGEKILKPHNQRPEFWNVRSWEIPSEIFVPHMFPEPDLMKTLIDLFFTQINTLLFSFHEPTFRSAVAAGLHLRDQKFGAVVLVVCALGAKFSEDPRVFLEGANSEHSAGALWYRQVRPLPASFLVTPSLYDLQLLFLSVMYLASGSIPEECWTLVGVGIRMAYDVGAHRRIRSQHGNTVETEEYKRAFWLLLCSDIIMSSLLGRPRAANIQDLDIGLPAALEGEEPIVAVYPPLVIKLMEIWGRIQDVIYPIKRKEQNYQEIVAEFDSALNQWVDSIPDELRWDPHRKDLIRLNQSASVYATYYILLHRPFIPSPGNHSSLSSISFPSLAICANAARSCGHVMDVQARRGAGPLYNPQTITALFDSAVVLLLNVFNRRPSADQSVQKCLNVLRDYERRYTRRDIISGMLDVGAALSTPSSLKRTRSSEEIPSSETIPDVFRVEEPRHIVGSRRVGNVIQDIEQLQVSDQEIERLLFLPLHTEDLGRLPIYEPFDFDSIFQLDALSESTMESDEVDLRNSHAFFPFLHVVSSLLSLPAVLKL